MFMLREIFGIGSANREMFSDDVSRVLRTARFMNAREGIELGEAISEGFAAGVNEAQSVNFVNYDTSQQDEE